MAKRFIAVEQTGTTFRSTDQCQILVAVVLYTLLEIRKACGAPPFPQMGYMYISLTTARPRDSGRPPNSWVQKLFFLSSTRWVDATKQRCGSHWDDVIYVCQL